ncbi:MAG: fused MFS/spermidine synthase [Elusimicrobiota bacterium]
MSRALPRSPLLYLIFFFSGCASLISEVAFNRMLVLVVGNTVSSTGMIVMAFMGGLGLGSYLGGRAFGGKRTSLWAYAVLEACIGVYALGSPFLFKLMNGVFAALAPALGGSAVVSFVRFALVFGFLFVPAILMGATFPAIVAGAASGTAERRASRTGYLYGVNTLGAAAGCLGAGYLLLPALGIRVALMWACCLNLFAAGGAACLTRAPSEARPAPPAAPSARPSFGSAASPDPGGPFLGLVGVATFAVGFVSLAYQVLLTRLAILFFGNGLVVFSLVLTAFLLGTGTSALAWTWIQRFGRHLKHVFSATLALAGAAVVLPPPFMLALARSELSWVMAGQDILVAAAILLPTFLMGGLLPLAIRLFQTERRPDTAANAGRLYALNTIGGMLGGGLANWCLVPALGTQGTLSAFALVLVALGVIAGWRLQRPLMRRASTLAAALFFGFYFAKFPRGMERLYVDRLTAGVGGLVRLHREGRAATVTVLDFMKVRDLFLNGIEEASTRFFHVQGFKVLGLLPAMIHADESPKEALMISFGAGISAGATVLSGLVSSLEVVDINPDVEGVSDLFKEVNGDAYRRPELRFIAQDGRNFLLAGRKKYPLIIADATHPLAYDSWILYTREFYELVKERLSDDGVFAQWLPLDLPEEMCRILLGTFSAAFPSATFWNIYGSGQSFLLATPGPLELDLKRLQRLLDGVPPSLRLPEYELDDAASFAGFFLMDAEAIAEFVGDERRVNTDDLPYNQLLSARRIKEFHFGFDQYQSSVLPLLKNASDRDRRRIADLQVVARAMRRYFSYRDPAALAEAFAISPADGNVAYGCREESSTPIGPKDLDDLGKRAAEFGRQAKGSAGHEEKGLALARRYLELDFVDEAESALKEVLSSSPGSAGAHRAAGDVALRRREMDYEQRMEVLLDLAHKRPNYAYYTNQARVRYLEGDYDEAERLLAKSLELYPTSTSARLNLADLLMRAGRRDAAVSRLKEVLEINPYNRFALARLAALHASEGERSEAARYRKSLARADRLRSPDYPVLYPCGEYCKPWEEAWIAAR